MRFDLGGTVLQIYATPGHTPGSVVILDENTGDLFASDSFGSNRREIPDSAWLQLSGYSLESCLRSLEAPLDAAGNKCKRIFTGHDAEMIGRPTNTCPPCAKLCTTLWITVQPVFFPLCAAQPSRSALALLP